MTPTVKQLLAELPESRGLWVTVKDHQTVTDIINEVLAAHKEFAPYYDNIALYFDDDDVEGICRNIYDFLKGNIRYYEEGEEEQTTALPSGILTRLHGDCKHYSSFAAGVLDGINRLTGKKIDWCYRFASYSFLNQQPHHVFLVVKDQDGEEIWIDPTPGAIDKIPVWQIDKKVKVQKMALRRQIAGIGMGYVAPEDMVYLDSGSKQIVYTEALPVLPDEELSPEVRELIAESEVNEELTPELQGAIELLLQYGVMNEAGEISDVKMSELASSLQAPDFAALANAREVLQIAITERAFMGSVFSDIWRGVKKVALSVPRNAYLGLVAVNAFGFATKLHNAIYNSDGTFFQPNQDKLYRMWHSLGGDWGNLRNAINAGAKKPAILGSMDRASVGVAPAAPAVPAWVAAAAAIIAALSPLIMSMMKTKYEAGRLDPMIDPRTGLPRSGPTTPPPTTGSLDIMQWVKDNPALAAAGVLGIYFILNSEK
jgi:hypothetical protein